MGFASYLAAQFVRLVFGRLPYGITIGVRRVSCRFVKGRPSVPEGKMIARSLALRFQEQFNHPGNVSATGWFMVLLKEPFELFE